VALNAESIMKIIGLLALVWSAFVAFQLIDSASSNLLGDTAAATPASPAQ